MWRFSGQAWGSLVLLLLHASSRIRHAAAHNMTGLSFEVLDAAAIARMTVRTVEWRGKAHGRLNLGWALRSLAAKTLNTPAAAATHRTPLPRDWHAFLYFHYPSLSAGRWISMPAEKPLLTSLLHTDGAGPHHLP